MSATILGLARTDRSRPLPDASALPGGLFGDEMPDVIHADDDLLLLTPASRPARCATDGDLTVTVLGHVLAVLDPAFADADPADPRTALEMFRTHGAEAIKHLDGHVALVVKDGADVLLIQDRNPGVVNLHWLDRDGVVAFSDRFAPLLAAYPDVTSRLDHGALREYLGRSYVCAPRTAYADVKRLGPGASLKAASGGAVLGQVDDWIRSNDGPSDETEALATYRGLLTDALSRWFARDPDAGFLLSGGLDSSVNVALGTEAAGRPVRTVGIAADGFTTDAPYARAVAEQYGADHHEHMLDGTEVEQLPRLIAQLEQPFYEPGMMLTWCAVSAAADRFGTVIGGETADQLFGACAAPASARLAARRKWGAAFGPGLGLARAVFRGPGRNSTFLRKVENKLIGEYDVATWCGRYGFRDCDLPALLRRPVSGADLYADARVPDADRDALFDFGCTVLNRDYALDGILLPTGRFADHLGIETFSPFLSRPVGDFILSLPWDLRLVDHPDRPGDFVYKRLHRLLSYELLPRDVVDRPKQGGAIDTLIHFQDPEWRDLVRRGLLASPFLSELCRPEAVAGLFEAVELHAVRIMELVALDLWHRMFVEGEMGVGESTLSEHFKGRVSS